MDDIDKLRLYLNQPVKVRIAKGVEVELYPAKAEDYPRLYSTIFSIYTEDMIGLEKKSDKERGAVMIKAFKQLTEEQIRDLIAIVYNSLSQGNIDPDIAKQIAARYWTILIPKLIEISLATVE